MNPQPTISTSMSVFGVSYEIASDVSSIGVAGAIGSSVSTGQAGSTSDTRTGRVGGTAVSS
jgi:hypothetical protein